MLLDNVLDALLLKIVSLVLLEIKTDLGAAAESRVDLVRGDGESTARSRLPDVLLVIVVLRDDLYALGDEVRGVETNTELTDHGDVGPGAERLHEALDASRCR